MGIFEVATQLNKDNRLEPKYYGPYKVLQNISSMVYKLELPISSWVNPVFHVSCLKKVIRDKIPIQIAFPDLDEEGKVILENEKISETRLKQVRNRVTEYLVKWKNLLVEYSTREDESFIQKHPHLITC